MNEDTPLQWPEVCGACRQKVQGTIAAGRVANYIFCIHDALRELADTDVTRYLAELGDEQAAGRRRG